MQAGKHAHAPERTHACTQTEREMPRQTGLAAAARARKWPGAQLAVSGLVIKGAKKINFQFSPKPTSEGKKKKIKEERRAEGTGSMSSRFEVMFWMCPEMKLVSRASEFPKENALLNLAVSTCCSRHLCSWHAWHSQSNLVEKPLNIKLFFLHLHS